MHDDNTDPSGEPTKEDRPTAQRDRVALVFGLQDAMLAKLHRDAHKGPWKHSDPMVLFTRLLDEAQELQAAVLKGEHPRAVLAEAADVANFAAMVADAYAHQFVEDKEL